MASSGQVTLSTQSVDYPCCPYGRGHITLTNIIGWRVDNSNNISFWSISSSDTAGGFWGICHSAATSPYYVHLVPQVSYDNGTTWVTLADAKHLVASVCTDPPQPQTYVNTIAMSLTLIESLSSYRLNGNCMLRFLYYMDPAPAPSDVNPNAFPNESYSEAVQVPVDIEISYRPGAVLDGDKWLSHNRSGGSCHILTNVSDGEWSELRTIGAPTEVGNPPSTYHDSKWFNQLKLGKDD